MKNRNLRIVVVCLGLALSVTFARNGISDTSKPARSTSQSAERHASSLTARITLHDGTYRTATIDGVGCTAAICSRVFVEGETIDGSVTKVWLDTLSAIQDTTTSTAVFVTKDGTQQRLSLITDFRVLYLQEGSAKPEKLDLSKIRSLQMMESAR